MLASDYVKLFEAMTKGGISPQEASVQIVVKMIEEIQKAQDPLRGFDEKWKALPEGKIEFSRLARNLGETVIRKQSDWQDFVRAINKLYPSKPLSENSFDNILRKSIPQLLELADIIRKERYDQLVERRRRGLERF
jgi:hypothetical protein